MQNKRLWSVVLARARIAVARPKLHGRAGFQVVGRLVHGQDKEDEEGGVWDCGLTRA